MRYLFIFPISILLTACGTSKLVETPLENSASPLIETSEDSPGNQKVLEQSVPKPIEFTNAGIMEKLVSDLASDALGGREAGSAGIEKAADYIEDYLKSAGIPPYYISYRDTLSNFKPISYNMVAVIQGNDPDLKGEYILFGAHYDHIGTVTPVKGDAIANGANDNASGSATILEIARYFSEKKLNKRSLIFAWFSAEEKGLLGSKHLAKRMKEEGLNLYAMLNFEMVGVPLQHDSYMMYITGYEKSNLAEIGNAHAKMKLLGFLPTAKSYNLYMRSDNYPFTKEFQVPAHTFCTFDFTNFDYYHKPDDEAQALDFEHMANLVNQSLPMLEGICNASIKELKNQNK